MRRVLRYDGILPDVVGDDRQRRDVTPDDMRAIGDFVASNRTETTAFDIIMEGETPGDDPARAAAIVRRWADAGATWWIETRWEVPRDADGLKVVRERIRQGPPRLDS
jgi:hypothetical protein